jgi:hypothetical protein
VGKEVVVDAWMLAVVVVVVIIAIYGVVMVKQARNIDAKEPQQRTGPPD